MATGQPQQFCVRWNSYQSNLQNAFPKLLTSEHFVDVTLACESEMIKCHKVVLSACSTYFEKLLVQNPCQHPIIFMKDMRFAEMQALVDFMYKGEVNVTQDELPSLLRSAEALQIRGLCGSDQLLSQHYLGSLQSAQGSQSSTANGISSATAPAASSSTDKKEPATSSDAKKKDDTPVTVNADDLGRSETLVKKETSESVESSTGGGSIADESERVQTSAASSQCSAVLKDDLYDNEDSYYDNDTDLMDTDYLDQDDDDLNQPGTSGYMSNEKSPEYAMANVSCQYSSDGSPGSGIPGARRIRRSEAELRRAAECITRGQTFQTVSDQFNIPISTIRFYMARKGILPRRKRGRACSVPSMQMAQHSNSNTTSNGGSGGFHSAPGNTSPIGPPYHIVHYKLPALGAKLK